MAQRLPEGIQPGCQACWDRPAVLLPAPSMMAGRRMNPLIRGMQAALFCRCSYRAALTLLSNVLQNDWNMS